MKNNIRIVFAFLGFAIQLGYGQSTKDTLVVGECATSAPSLCEGGTIYKLAGEDKWKCVDDSNPSDAYIDKDKDKIPGKIVDEIYQFDKTSYLYEDDNGDGICVAAEHVVLGPPDSPELDCNDDLNFIGELADGKFSIFKMSSGDSICLKPTADKGYWDGDKDGYTKKDSVISAGDALVFPNPDDTDYYHYDEINETLTEITDNYKDAESDVVDCDDESESECVNNDYYVEDPSSITDVIDHCFQYEVDGDADTNCNACTKLYDSTPTVTKVDIYNATYDTNFTTDDEIAAAGFVELPLKLVDNNNTYYLDKDDDGYSSSNVNVYVNNGSAYVFYDEEDTSLLDDLMEEYDVIENSRFIALNNKWKLEKDLEDPFIIDCDDDEKFLYKDCDAIKLFQDADGDGKYGDWDEAYKPQEDGDGFFWIDTENDIREEYDVTWEEPIVEFDGSELDEDEDGIPDDYQDCDDTEVSLYDDCDTITLYIDEDDDKYYSDTLENVYVDNDNGDYLVYNEDEEYYESIDPTKGWKEIDLDEPKEDCNDDTNFLFTDCSTVTLYIDNDGDKYYADTLANVYIGNVNGEYIIYDADTEDYVTVDTSKGWHEIENVQGQDCDDTTKKIKATCPSYQKIYLDIDKDKFYSYNAPKSDSLFFVIGNDLFYKGTFNALKGIVNNGYKEETLSIVMDSIVTHKGDANTYPSLNGRFWSTAEPVLNTTDLHYGKTAGEDCNDLNGFYAADDCPNCGEAPASSASLPTNVPTADNVIHAPNIPVGGACKLDTDEKLYLERKFQQVMCHYLSGESSIAMEDIFPVANRSGNKFGSTFAYGTIDGKEVQSVEDIKTIALNIELKEGQAVNLAPNYNFVKQKEVIYVENGVSNQDPTTYVAKYFTVDFGGLKLIKYYANYDTAAAEVKEFIDYIFPTEVERQKIQLNYAVNDVIRFLGQSPEIEDDFIDYLNLLSSCAARFVDPHFIKFFIDELISNGESEKLENVIINLIETTYSFDGAGLTKEQRSKQLFDEINNDISVLNKLVGKIDNHYQFALIGGTQQNAKRFGNTFTQLFATGYSNQSDRDALLSSSDEFHFERNTAFYGDCPTLVEVTDITSNSTDYTVTYTHQRANRFYQVGGFVTHCETESIEYGNENNPIPLNGFIRVMLLNGSVQKPFVIPAASYYSIVHGKNQIDLYEQLEIYAFALGVATGVDEVFIAGKLLNILYRSVINAPNTIKSFIVAYKLRTLVKQASLLDNALIEIRHVDDLAKIFIESEVAKLSGDLRTKFIDISKLIPEGVWNKIDNFEDVTKSRFFDDWDNALEFRNALSSKPELVDSWKRLENFTDLRRDHLVLESYSKVKRIGSYTDNVTPTKVSELTRAHGAPKLGQEGDILLHQNTFSTTGYDLSQPIPVVELPDGTALMIDGHHRLKALENLEQVVVPVQRFNLQDAISAFTEDEIAVLVEVSKLSGNYTGTFKVDLGAIENIRIKTLAEFFMDDFFPGWR